MVTHISTRYFCMLLPSKDICKDILDKINLFLKSYLKLEMNDKTFYYPSKFGVNFCGYIIKENKIILRKRFIKNIKRKMKKDNFELLNFKGHLIHANSNNFIINILKNRLKIDGINKVIYIADKFEDITISKNIKIIIEDEINKVKELFNNNYDINMINTKVLLNLNDINKIIFALNK